MTQIDGAGTVLLTDRAWPDDSVERTVLENAGLQLVSGPPQAGSASAIEELVARHRPSAILTNWAPVSAVAIAATPELRLVARLGVGLDNIAVAAATEHGVLVTNVPDYCVEEVSDHAIALALAWTRGIVSTDRQTRAGSWSPANARLRRLATLTCGIVGYGRIGRHTAQKLQAFGAQVIATDPHPPARPGTVDMVPLEKLLAESDLVILHAPLAPGTHRLIGERELAMMRAGAFLINVSRGGLVDTDALTNALDSGKLSGAGLDVLETEPEVPPGLLHHPGVVITPHVAFSSDVSVAELRRRAAEEVVRVLRGRSPQFACNSPLPTTANAAPA